MLQRLIAYNLWNGWGYILYTYNILYTYMYLCMYILHIMESTYRSIADVLVSNLFDPPVLHTFAAARVNLCRLERLCAATQQRSSIPILRRSRSTKLGWLDVGETSRKIELRTPANPVSQAFLSKDSLTNDSGLEFENNSQKASSSMNLLHFHWFSLSLSL